MTNKQELQEEGRIIKRLSQNPYLVYMSGHPPALRWQKNQNRIELSYLNL